MPTTRYYPRLKLRGGRYEKLSCYGSYTMLGSVRADSMVLTGNLEGQYGLTVGSLRTTGSVRVPTLRGNNIFFYGTSSVRSFLQISKSLAILGYFIGDCNVVCPIVNMEGTVTLNGRITAVQITAKGVLSLGALNAEDIRMEFAERSRCGGLLGKKIIITRRPLPALAKLFMPMQASQNSFCTVNDGITGEYVSIEHVITDTVKGADVNIGPGCRINKVYYRDHLYIDEQAYVGWYEPYDDNDSSAEGNDV